MHLPHPAPWRLLAAGTAAALAEFEAVAAALEEQFSPKAWPLPDVLDYR